MVDSQFNVVLLVLYGDGLRQVGVKCIPTVSWLVAEGSLGLGWHCAVSVCCLLCVGAFFVFLVSELRFGWFFLRYQW